MQVTRHKTPPTAELHATGEQACDCNDEQNRRYVPALTPEAQAEQERKARQIRQAAGAGAAAAGAMAVLELIGEILGGLLLAL
jgi:hypothetical protein